MSGQAPPSMLAGAILGAAVSACAVAPGIPDGAIVFGALGPQTAPDRVLIYDGRPARRYEVIGWVRACSTFSPVERDLREQAAGIGADAVIERSITQGLQCEAGVAVRFRE